jgi:aromatic ring-cleaving dioxygenase
MYVLPLPFPIPMPSHHPINLPFTSVPELRIYRLFNQPVGPHVTAMFEVNIHTPAQFGAFIPWLVIHRGPLSALIHPNTDTGVEVDEEMDGEGDGDGDGRGEEERNHTQRATWMGERIPLDLGMFKRMREGPAPGGK